MNTVVTRGEGTGERAEWVEEPHGSQSDLLSTEP